ncbi:MAG: hypothetical protein DI535_05755 [Citrobacter freundii]|nr:MAG: hypothetical protein DI535_05755 [Citrobacter freundii]
MKAISVILNRSVTEQFYKQHAGAFLFTFFILFGIQPSAADLLQFHYSVIVSILQSATFFGVASLVWSLYTLKAVLFIRGCLKKESYDFIYLLLGVERNVCLLQLAGVLAAMLAPLFAYGSVIMIVAVQRKLWLSGAGVLATMLLLFVLSVMITWRLIQRGKNNQLTGKKTGLPGVRSGLFSMLMQFVFRKQLITLLILKTVAFTALYFFAKTDSQVFEGRMLWLLFITVLIGHGVIIFRNFQFMENDLYFYRNMPVSKWYTLLSLLALYSIILIPEFWALKGIIFIQHDLREYCWLLLTGPSVLLLIHSLLYSEDNKMEEFLALLFGIWVIFIFFSLSGNRWLMPAVGCVFGLVIFMVSYYRYEKKVDTEVSEPRKKKGFFR